LLEEQATATELNQTREALMTASQVLGQKIYEASAAESAAAGEAEETPSGDDVVEAEIVDEGEEA
jgi:molecular chaperone DnaK